MGGSGRPCPSGREQDGGSYLRRPLWACSEGGKVLDWLLEVGTSRVILSPDSDFRMHPHLCRWGPRSISEPFLTRELESWRPSARGIDDAHQVGRPTEAYQVRDMNRGG